MSKCKFISFSSGSAGNCYFLKSGATGRALLVDAGISMRRLKKNLAEIGETYDSIDAVLVTHDHLDHIRHLGAYCERLKKPVYLTSTLLGALRNHTFTRFSIDRCAVELEEDITEIAGFRVTPFEVPHDATQTVGYFISSPEDALDFTIMTDLGSLTPEAFDFARRCSTLVIESNYDVAMLFAGPYTHELKMRISTGHGHLSNDGCAEALSKIVHDGLKNVFLCHLSENNNTPQLAYSSASEVIDTTRIRLAALPRRTPSQLFEI
ncbi:MAG: MBL fold metallo-hydrolase [Bacteroidales bacterium]|nr:MBL fold metallo-hydrolase [Bacteroidales bacterium]